MPEFRRRLRLGYFFPFAFFSGLLVTFRGASAGAIEVMPRIANSGVGG
jgi:hypothetical protein